MSPEEVVENARIGDIFLFENNSFAAGCIQCWTRSDFGYTRCCCLNVLLLLLPGAGGV